MTKAERLKALFITDTDIVEVITEEDITKLEEAIGERNGRMSDAEIRNCSGEHVECWEWTDAQGDWEVARDEILSQYKEVTL